MIQGTTALTVSALKPEKDNNMQSHLQSVGKRVIHICSYIVISAAGQWHAG